MERFNSVDSDDLYRDESETTMTTAGERSSSIESDQLYRDQSEIRSTSGDLTRFSLDFPPISNLPALPSRRHPPPPPNPAIRVAPQQFSIPPPKNRACNLTIIALIFCSLLFTASVVLLSFKWLKVNELNILLKEEKSKQSQMEKELNIKIKECNDLQSKLEFESKKSLKHLLDLFSFDETILSKALNDHLSQTHQPKSIQIMETLIEKNADVGSIYRNHEEYGPWNGHLLLDGEMTAIDFALQQDEEHILEYLLAHLDTHSKSQYLYWVCKKGDKKHIKRNIKKLREFGADVEWYPKANECALDVVPKEFQYLLK